MTRSGHDGTPSGQDFAEYVRHALHAAADQVEPRPDGLERIRARVESGPALRQRAVRGDCGCGAGGFPGRDGPALECQAQRDAGGPSGGA